MRVGLGRLWIALLVATVSFTVAAAYDNDLGPNGYQDVKNSECWSCHAGWSPPLREMASLQPPSGIEAQIDQEFEYPVRMANGWISDLVRVEPSLDLSHAPSLAFVSDRAPTLGQIVRGVIPVSTLPTDGSQATDFVSGLVSEREDVQVIEVQAGVTDLRITVAPENLDPQTGPDLSLNAFAAKDEAKGNPDVTVDATGKGQAEVLHITGGTELSELGFGPWALEVVAAGVGQSQSPSQLADVPYTITIDRWYNTSGETVQFLEKVIDLGPSGTTVFSWSLRVTDTPAPGEVVRISANVTSHYKHDDGGTKDRGYTHHTIEVPVAASPAGGATFDLDAGTIFVENPDVPVSLSRISEVVGYVSAFLVLASIYTGGMFGKASRRQLNGVFQSAKRRVAFHNFLSYGIILAAFVHMVIFLWPLPNIEGNYHWTLGLIWGSLSILALFGLGFTGALQVPMIRRWNYGVWRWSHLGLSIAVIVFTIVHILLDGGNFGDVQEAIGWQNPLDPREGL